jgi:outer membrane lipoprotein-sorting protein
MRLRVPWLISIASWLLFSGCAVNQPVAKKPTGPPAPLQTATREELITQYNRGADAVTSINASITMTLTAGSAYSGVIKQYHQVSGFIVAEKPSKIRVIGQAPVVGTNIFDMESDGQTFNIFIPSQNKFLTGPANLERPSAKPIENLRPQHLTSAIFWQPVPDGAPVLMENASEADGQYYVLTIVRIASQADGAASESSRRADWEIARKIWFDRTNLKVSRLQTYDSTGKIASDIRYTGWDTFDSVNYPRQIALSRPANDYKLQIGITKATFNEPLPDDRFVLRKPPGAELVNVGESSQPAKVPAASSEGKKP